MLKLRAKLAAAMSLNMVLWLIMLLLFAGLLGSAAALYLALAAIWPNALAMFLAGLALLCVGGVLAALLWRAVRASPQAEKPDIEHMVANDVRAVVGDRTADWVRDNTGMAIFCAVATGAMLGASPGLRQAAVRVVTPVVKRVLARAAEHKSDI